MTGVGKMYIAHISEDDERIQSLKDHLLNVRALCEQWGSKIGLQYVCGLAGWLHDAGKYSQKFQKYIRDPNGKRGSVDHATAGAILLYDFSRGDQHDFNQEFSPKKDGSEALIEELLGNVIMAHHNSKGALDFIDPVILNMPFTQRLNKQVKGIRGYDANYQEQYQQVVNNYFTEFEEEEFADYYSKALSEIKQIGNKVLINDQNFYLRYVLSVLIDADHTDTANFEGNTKFGYENNQHDILNQYFDVNEKAVQTQICENTKEKNNKTKKLNWLRQEMSDACFTAAGEQTGIYSLSVPTGGGKTLSSLRFALRKAQLQNVDRIIYVVPYTTIIEQNANVIRNRLNGSANKTDNILEYHSTVTQEPKKDSYYYSWDSWDSPIILTSQVAYLNALFGKGSKNIRHMHQLVHAVVIFDEIQTLPIKCIEMNNAALKWLKIQGTTSLLCTATQPALDKIRNGLPISKEIVPDLKLAQQAFKRVTIQPVFNSDKQLKVFSLEDLTEFIDDKLQQGVHSLLVILNTKAAVRNAYEALNDQKDLFKYHLSTAMCSKHRQVKFSEIKKQLENPQKNSKKVVVFSTNLIEAGVDLSFECVIRSCAGLDSVVQAAGRCNRNNEVKLGYTYLIQMDKNVENVGGPLKFLGEAAGITKVLLANNVNRDLLSDEIMRDYFIRLYAKRSSDLPYPSDNGLKLYPLIGSSDEDKEPNVSSEISYYQKSKKIPSTYLSVAPNTVAKLFQVIDSSTTDVIVQYGEGKKLVAELISQKSKFESISGLLKQVQKYCVSVYGNREEPGSYLGKLMADGSVRYCQEQDIFIAEDGSYSEEFGLGEGKFDSLDY